MSLADYLAKDKNGKTHSLKPYNFNTNSVASSYESSFSR